MALPDQGDRYYRGLLGLMKCDIFPRAQSAVTSSSSIRVHEPGWVEQPFSSEMHGGQTEEASALYNTSHCMLAPYHATQTAVYSAVLCTHFLHHATQLNSFHGGGALARGRQLAAAISCWHWSSRVDRKSLEVDCRRDYINSSTYRACIRCLIAEV